MSFLDRVLAQKREELETKKRTRPVADLEREMGTVVPRQFRTALERPGGKLSTQPGARELRAVIAELKARTPTIERFEQSENLEALATTYDENGASAVSIVTDERNFGTSLATVRMARRRTALPILVKDFVFDPYQVLEARSAGADAVLLIARILDWDQLTGLLDLSRQIGMDALVETHNEEEMKMALHARATLVGINNRDLDALDVSLETTRRVARLVPDDVLLVAESGIRSRADIETLAACGADAFLIGGGLLSATDPASKLREFVGIE